MRECAVFEEFELSFKYAMLGLLVDGPRHGYELKSSYEGELLPTARVNFGQVYTTLERLSREGLVEFEEVNQAERPDKKVYSITTEGRTRWKAWLAAPTVLAGDQRNETFLKLMLARRLKRFDPLKCLATERQACFRRLQEVTQAKVQAEKEGAQLQTILVLELAVLQMDAFLTWLDRCEELLQQEKTA